MQTAAQNAASGVNGFSATASDIFTCTPGGTAVTQLLHLLRLWNTPIEYVQVERPAPRSPRMFSLSRNCRPVSHFTGFGDL